MDLLDTFTEHNVGAINWGLVDGKTQTRWPWRSWEAPMNDDEPWFHELLHADGTPYRQEEIELIQKLTSKIQPNARHG